MTKEEKDSTTPEEIIQKESSNNDGHAFNVSEDFQELVSKAQKVLKSFGVEKTKRKIHEDLNNQYLKAIPTILKQINERAEVKLKTKNEEDTNSHTKTPNDEQLSESIQNLKDNLSNLRPYFTPSPSGTNRSSLDPTTEVSAQANTSAGELNSSEKRLNRAN